MDPAIQLALLEHIGNGETLANAAELVGLNPKTVNRWWHRGEIEATEPYHSFHKAVRKAIAVRRSALNKVLVDHARDDPREARRQEESLAAFVDDPQRESKMLEGEAPTLPAIEATTNIIMVKAEDLDAIVAQREAAEEEAVDDATRAARARLVTDLSSS